MTSGSGLFVLSVLVVVRRRALAGQEQALLAAMAAELRGSRPPRSLRARVFQGLSDRRAAIYIAEWSSREAYLTYNTPPLVTLAMPAHRTDCPPNHCWRGWDWPVATNRPPS